MVLIRVRIGGSPEGAFREDHLSQLDPLSRGKRRARSRHCVGLCSSSGLPVYGSNLYFGASVCCVFAGGAVVGSVVISCSASFSPFLNSTMPRPKFLPTS